MPKTVRTQLLRAIRKGATVPQAAGAAGFTQQAVWGRARIDTEWRTALDAALMDGRRPDVPHGTPAGYRHYKCRCRECCTAHHRTDAA